jgi:hypothetical protein
MVAAVTYLAHERPAHSLPQPGVGDGLQRVRPLLLLTARAPLHVRVTSSCNHTKDEMSRNVRGSQSLPRFLS